MSSRRTRAIGSFVCIIFGTISLGLFSMSHAYYGASGLVFWTGVAVAAFGLIWNTVVFIVLVHDIFTNH